MEHRCIKGLQRCKVCAIPRLRYARTNGLGAQLNRGQIRHFWRSCVTKLGLRRIELECEGFIAPRIL